MEAKARKLHTSNRPGSKNGYSSWQRSGLSLCEGKNALKTIESVPKEDAAKKNSGFYGSVSSPLVEPFVIAVDVRLYVGCGAHQNSPHWLFRCLIDYTANL
jgi:hypothetical protein